MVALLLTVKSRPMAASLVTAKSRPTVASWVIPKSPVTVAVPDPSVVKAKFSTQAVPSQRKVVFVTVPKLASSVVDKRVQLPVAPPCHT